MKTVIAIGPLTAELDHGERPLPAYFEPYRALAAARKTGGSLFAGEGEAAGALLFAPGGETAAAPLLRVPCPDAAALVFERGALQEEPASFSGEALEREVFLTALYRGLAEQLPAQGAAVLHGSCLALDGEAYLFLALSGTGKSTHSRLWREVFGERVVMVNDDKPVLLLQNGQVFACGTPWNGKHRLGTPGAWPLKGLCLLSRGAENRIERVERGAALPGLLPFIYRPKTQQGLLQTLALAEAVTGRVPLYSLTCNMDPEAARVSCRGMKEGTEA